jgi:death-on-curing protein
VGPAFLTMDELLAVHADQLQRYGGFLGVRDMDTLESALAVPEASMNGHFVHEDLPAMAAAYLYHIARYKPFVDGNKRTGAMAVLVFLNLNGLEVTCEAAELQETVRAAADGELDKASVAKRLRGAASSRV